MKKIITKDYPILIGRNLIEKLKSLIKLTKYSKIFIVTDKNVKAIFLNKILSQFTIDSSYIVLPDGEKQKNIENVQKIWRAMLTSHCDRKTLVINLGGGVIGDIGGFTATTFMRGLDFLQIPTTLLSQIDSSIGGKVGINFGGIKNLIGSFQQPIAVIIDVNFLKTLPNKEFISGFAEIIKHSLIADKKYFQLVTNKRPTEYSQKELVEIIQRSCQIKAEIVSADEKEDGLRKLLNFGHTIGHAIESLSQETKNPLLHGEAISIGMVVEAQISNLVGLLSDADYHVLEQALVKAGLPVKLPNIKTEQILEKIKSDKKSEKDKINWTLLRSIGKAVINQQVNKEIIKKIL